MPLSATDRKTFDDKVVPGVREVFGSDALTRTQASFILAELEKNPSAANSFFAAKIFDVPMVRSGSTHVCRAIMCIKAVNGVVIGGVSADKITAQYNSMLIDYRTDDRKKNTYRLELTSMIAALGTARGSEPTMSSEPLRPQDTASHPDAIAPVFLPTELEKRMKANFLASISSAGASGGRSNLAYRLTNEISSSRTGPFIPVDQRVLAPDTLTAKVTSDRESAILDVKTKFLSLANQNLVHLTKMGEQVDSAYDNFSAVYRDAGEAGNARLKLISMIATKTLSAIPVVGSVVGAVAGACIDSLKYNTKIAQTDYERAPPIIDQSSAISRMVGAVTEKVDKHTTLGVRADTIPTVRSIRQLLRDSWAVAQEGAETALKETLQTTFEMEGDARQQARSAQQRIALHGNKFGSYLHGDVINSIKKDKEDIKRALENYFMRRVMIPDDKMSKYVELSLFATYMEQLVKTEKFHARFADIKGISFSLPAPVATRLIQLEIIQPKGSSHYIDVVNGGRLPYDGHQVHDLGLLLFFRWYADVNPFEMIGSSTFTPAKLDAKIKQYITSIGAAINSSKSKGFFRSGVKDMTQIASVHENQVKAIRA